MERDGVRCWDDQVDSPANRERPDERHDRERHGEHPEAEVRRRHVVGRSVVILIEEAEASCEDEQRGGDHQTANPPDRSQLLASQSTHFESHPCMSIASPAPAESPPNILNSRGSLGPAHAKSSESMGHERHSRGARSAPHSRERRPSTVRGASVSSEVLRCFADPSAGCLAEAGAGDLLRSLPLLATGLGEVPGRRASPNQDGQESQRSSHDPAHRRRPARGGRCHRAAATRRGEGPSATGESVGQSERSSPSTLTRRARTQPRPASKPPRNTREPTAT